MGTSTCGRFAAPAGIQELGAEASGDVGSAGYGGGDDRHARNLAVPLGANAG